MLLHSLWCPVEYHAWAVERRRRDLVEKDPSERGEEARCCGPVGGVRPWDWRDSAGDRAGLEQQDVVFQLCQIDDQIEGEGRVVRRKRVKSRTVV